MIAIVKKNLLNKLEKENEQFKEQLSQAAEFVSVVSKGDLQVDFHQVPEEQTAKELYENLLSLKNSLLQMEQEEKQRSWVTQGLANFVDILRNDKDSTIFYDTIISNLVKYLNANQGGLFVLNDSDKSAPILELKACYAYNRKKFGEKTILPKEGLVGQCFIEEETIYMTDIPQNYVNITSGLGEATPATLLIVPLKTNKSVVGVIEIASFQSFDKYKIDFVEKLSESIASAISSTMVNENTRQLLIRTQESTEQLRAQEEELRQNMEEMSTLQDELERQLDITKEIKVELEIRERVFGLTTILSESDKHGTITYTNDKLTQVSKYSREELIGKGHNIFRHPDMPRELFKAMWGTIKQGRVFSGIVKNRAKDGTHYWVDATIVPVLNKEGEIIKYIGARYHIKDDRLAETLYNEQTLIKQLNMSSMQISQIRTNTLDSLFQ